MSQTAPQSPAGEYVPESNPSPTQRAERIAEMEALPKRVQQLVAGWTDAQLDTKYINWTVRQIIHHLADSHINAYIRFRLTLTENNPTVRPYDQSAWAELSDARSGDIRLSLNILEAVHARLVVLLKSMSDADFQKTYFHPEYKKSYTLGEVLGLYAYHGRHHSAQIEWIKRERL